MNEHRRRKALSDLVQQVHTEADRTRASLNSSHANDAKAVDVIWQNTRAPLITRAASQDGFTTFIQRSAIYDEAGMVLGGGPVKIDRCFALTYLHTATEWSESTRTVDGARCEPGRTLAQAAASARTRLATAARTGLTDTDVQRAFEVPSRAWSTGFDVRATRRQGKAVSIETILHLKKAGAAQQQCYQFDVTLPDGDQTPPDRLATARPVADSACATG
ncbi:hypothetical protein OG762_38180 [Streptomyces sp. NBC_01136]|uniref:hypothetical protein n=1 Tax=unclassified Streptomyces TaxID=2593676 RepID=UPI0032504AD5|nr:hypothetical protein OG762_38180 [Streptomyces sp. NBC_01136]